MKLQIIKPTKAGRAFVTITRDGGLYFNTRMVDNFGLLEKAGVFLAKDGNGQLYLKFSDNTEDDMFPMHISKTEKWNAVYIRIKPLLCSLGIEVKKSTRHYIVESEDGFYRIDGLKIGAKQWA